MLACAAVPARGGPVGAEMNLVGGVIVVDARLNGRGPYRFILDTGATETILTPATARDLGLRAGDLPAFPANATLDEMVVAGAQLSDLGVQVFDPPQARPLRLDQGLDYAGLLGYTVLSQCLLDIDYSKRRVRLRSVTDDPVAAERAWQDLLEESEARPVRIDMHRRLPHVSARINGRGPLRMILDTGSAEVVLLPASATRWGIKGMPLAGYRGVDWIAGASLDVGTRRKSGLPIVIYRPERGRVRGYDGILGTPFLRGFRVVISYRHNAMLLLAGG